MTAEFRSTDASDDRPSIQKNPESGLIYKTLFAKAQKDPTILLDAHKHIIALNEAAELIYGVDGGAVEGKPVREAIKMDVAESVLEESDKQLAEFGFSMFEGTFRRKDDVVFQLFFVLNKIVDRSGKAIGYTSVARNVTELRRKETRAVNTINIINHSSDAIFTTNNDLVIGSWSRGAERLYGITKEFAVGKAVGSIFPEPKRIGHVTRAHILAEVEAHGHWAGFLHNRFDMVGEVFVHASVDRSFDLDSKPVGYVIVHRELNQGMAEEIRAYYQPNIQS